VVSSFISRALTIVRFESGGTKMGSGFGGRDGASFLD
jgi:hypothetical protein